MNLDDWRSRINDLDNQILTLLNQRAEAALTIGDLKRRRDLPYFVPERVAEILNRLTTQNPGPLLPETVRAVWREILSGCLALEHLLTVAYLGPPATFTHQAALQYFGSTCRFTPARAITDVFDAVEQRQAEYGVVPVENNTEGAVNVTLDRLIDSDVVICGERYLTISQHLLSRAKDLSEVKTVISHPQGLAQCRVWLAQHMPNVRTQEFASTAGAAEEAASDPTIAAIASDLAGELYGVPVLRPHIEDNPHNATRFLIIGTKSVGVTQRDKTSILFATRDDPGSLYRILEPIARAGINLSKIESRPAKRRAWEYVMFVDFEGHQDSPSVKSALAEVKAQAPFLRVLGSYPAA